MRRGEDGREQKFKKPPKWQRAHAGRRGENRTKDTGSSGRPKDAESSAGIRKEMPWPGAVRGGDLLEAAGDCKQDGRDGRKGQWGGKLHVSSWHEEMAEGQTVRESEKAQLRE